MAFGDICPGWTARAWACELRRKADICGPDVQETAEYYRRWAAEIEKRLPPAEPEYRMANGE